MWDKKKNSNIPELSGHIIYYRLKDKTKFSIAQIPTLPFINNIIFRFYLTTLSFGFHICKAKIILLLV
jgi:hypothetical protein